MEKRDARPFQQVPDISERNWNIVELEVLESHRKLRQQVNELLRLANDPSVTTSEMQQHLHLGVTLFGNRLATQLVRSLHRDDHYERQNIVWLLTLLNDKETIPPLQNMSHNERLPRAIRFSASLALAGMGVTAEMIENQRRVRLFAI